MTARHLTDVGTATSYCTSSLGVVRGTQEALSNAHYHWNAAAHALGPL